MMQQKRQADLQPLMRRGIVAVGLFLVMLLSYNPAHAQSIQGSVLGTVKDTKGAVIPNAGITLTNTDTGTTRTAQTNRVGDYRFEDVVAGHYAVTVDAAGFQHYAVTGITLSVRQELRVDAKLGVGTVQQEVKVTSDSLSTLETVSPTISGTLTADDATNLPTNTRASAQGTSPASIFGALPGVQDDSSGISLQGALPYQVEVAVDGITVKSATGGNFIHDAFPSSESISEIRADGVLAGAEFSDPAQIAVTTKGGTNKFHGSGFWYYQSSAFDAIPYTNPTTTTKPSFHAGTFGGSVGGPVLIPGLIHRENNLFFYGDYEGWRYPSQQTIFAKVPTSAMTQGDFSGYIEPGGSFAGINDPFAYNTNWGTQIPGGLISQIATNTLKQFYPAPNTAVSHSACGAVDTSHYCDDATPNWQTNVDDSRHSDQFDVRADKYFGSNQKFLLWGKYGYKKFPTTSAVELLIPSSQQISDTNLMKVDANWTITPSVVNEAGFGYTLYTSGQSDSFNGNAWSTSQNWVGLQNLFYNGIPEMDFYNMTSLNADRLTSTTKSKTYDYSDNLTWFKGRHTMKFGGNVQHLEAITPLGFNGADNYGTYTFNTQGSAGLFTGVDFADFLLGLPAQTFYDVVKQDNDGLSNHYHVFAQDEWHVNPRLTLTYGLRYELHPGYYDRYGDIGNFDPSVALSGRVIYPQGKQSLLAQGYLASANACDPDGVNNTNNATVNGAPCMPVEGNSTAGYPAGLKKYPHLRFLPRVGFAFRPMSDDRWVIRGGAGIYNINMLGSSFYSLTGTVQAYTQQFSNTFIPATSTTAPTIGYQWPNIYAGSGSSGCTNCYGTDYFGTANSTNWKDPYTVQWMLDTEHDLGNGYVFRISYIGSETHHLVWAPDENTLPFSSTVSAYNAPITSRLFPNWGRINTRDTGANASYNSLQAELSHRLQHGLEFNSTFTWAKALADNQGPAGTGFGGEGGGQRATSILARHVDFGNVYGTRRLRWNTTMLYDLPFGRGHAIGGSMNRAADLIVGGWRISNILTVQTGPFETPYFPNGEGDPSGTGSGLNGAYGAGGVSFDTGHRNQHADVVPGVNTTPSGGRNRTLWVNPNAFTCPGDTLWSVGNSCTTGAGFDPHGNPIGNHPLPIGRFGNSQVGSVTGPGLVNLSTGVSKNFTLTDGLHLKVEGTFTNVLNHTNLSDPDMDLSSANFGQVNCSVSGCGNTAADFGGARTGQVSARIEF